MWEARLRREFGRIAPGLPAPVSSPSDSMDTYSVAPSFAGPLGALLVPA
jgi:hypothetical protein